MKILPCSPENILIAANCIAAGGVVAHATDTCYGLACVPKAHALQKLFTIKNRPATSAVSILVDSINMAQEIVEWSEMAESLAIQFWPGALSIILPAKANQPYMVTPNESPFTISVRHAHSAIADQLIAFTKSPIVSTSANIHGLPETYTVEQIVTQWHENPHKPDIVLESGVLTMNPPSTIVQVQNNQLFIRRIGALAQKINTEYFVTN